MGKASRWFRSLFSGSKKSSSDLPASSGSVSRSFKVKRGGLDSRNYATNRGPSSPYIDSLDPNKHAMAVAVATAAVAEAALAAAHAAAEVVRLTNGGGGGRVPTAAYYSSSSDRRRELAAVKIQSTFRAYLARRALRALKGLVKLQALVRGHIVRKQSADMLRRMQAMARIQARASVNRTCTSESSHSSSRSSHSHHPGLSIPVNYDQLRAHTNSDGSFMKGLSIPVNYDQLRAHTNSDGSFMKRSSLKPNTKANFGPDKSQMHANWLEHWMEENSWNNQRGTSVKYARAEDERNDKILEVDTWKPHLNPNPRVRPNQTLQQRNTLPSDSLSRVPTKSQKPNENQGLFSLGSIKQEQADQIVQTAESSPRVCSSSSRPGSSYKPSPFSPAKSEYSRSFFGDYMSYPSYMANTESYRAKLRSQSAPRQRLQFEKPGPTQRFWDVDTNSERGLGSPAKLRTKGCQGNSQFASGYNSTYGGRS